jgi:putative ABC transport system ATP-binding protein
MGAIIEFRDVRKLYVQGRRKVAALDGLSLAIEAGEFVVVTGPSGSGKSTLLHLAAALDLPTDGVVRVDGRETASMRDEELTQLRRTRIGLIFQFFNLIPTLSVLENVALPALLPGRRLAEVRPAAEALIDRVGLSDRPQHLPEELSGGEMQRVAIARALIHDPPVLLADEPTGNLDSVTGGEVLRLLQDLRGGRTLVIVTHDTSLLSLADRAVHLKDGRLA